MKILPGTLKALGVEFNIFNDTVNIVYVIPQGPSDKAGLQIGDKILAVNDSSLTSKTFSTGRDQKFDPWKERIKSLI
jgi:carboxyl-terminal processing protease